MYLAAAAVPAALDPQTTVADWMNDLNSDAGPSPEIPVKMYWTGHPAGPQDGTPLSNFSVIYDDELNVVFVVKDLSGTGKSWEHVRAFVASVNAAAEAAGLNGRIDSSAIAEAMPGLIRENAIGEDTMETLLSLLKPAVAGQFRQQIDAAAATA